MHVIIWHILSKTRILILCILVRLLCSLFILWWDKINSNIYMCRWIRSVAYRNRRSRRVIWILELFISIVATMRWYLSCLCAQSRDRRNGILVSGGYFRCHFISPSLSNKPRQVCYKLGRSFDMRSKYLILVIAGPSLLRYCGQSHVPFLAT